MHASPIGKHTYDSGASVLSGRLCKIAYMIGDRIKAARLEAGLTQQEVATEVGVSRAAVALWESNQSKTLKGQNLVRVARALNVTPDWLLTGRGSKHPIQLHPQDAASTGEIESVAIMVGKPHQDVRQIPVINYIQAGHPREVVDAYSEGDGFDTVGVDAQLAVRLGTYAFALEVSGESMLPDFKPGDIVIIDPDVQVRPGDIVVAKLDQEEAATLKKYRDRGRDSDGQPIFELVPLNDDYPVVVVDTGNPGILVGPVIEHRRKLR